MIAANDADWARETARRWRFGYEARAVTAWQRWRQWLAFKHSPHFMRNLRVTMAVLMCTGLTGCTSVPATKIHVTKSPNGVVTYVIESPKQVELEGLDVNEQTGAVKIQKLKSVNDATIISSQGQVNVDYLHEVRGLVTDVGSLTLQGAAKGATGGIAP